MVKLLAIGLTLIAAAWAAPGYVGGYSGTGFFDKFGFNSGYNAGARFGATASSIGNINNRKFESQSTSNIGKTDVNNGGYFASKTTPSKVTNTTTITNSSKPQTTTGKRYSPFDPSKVFDFYLNKLNQNKSPINITRVEPINKRNKTASNSGKYFSSQGQNLATATLGSEGSETTTGTQTEQNNVLKLDSSTGQLPNRPNMRYVSLFNTKPKDGLGFKSTEKTREKVENFQVKSPTTKTTENTFTRPNIRFGSKLAANVNSGTNYKTLALNNNFKQGVFKVVNTKVASNSENTFEKTKTNNFNSAFGVSQAKDKTVQSVTSNTTRRVNKFNPSDVFNFYLSRASNVSQTVSNKASESKYVSGLNSLKYFSTTTETTGSVKNEYNTTDKSNLPGTTQLTREPQSDKNDISTKINQNGPKIIVNDVSVKTETELINQIVNVPNGKVSIIAPNSDTAVESQGTTDNESLNNDSSVLNKDVNNQTDSTSNIKLETPVETGKSNGVNDILAPDQGKQSQNNISSTNVAIIHDDLEQKYSNKLNAVTISEVTIPPSAQNENVQEVSTAVYKTNAEQNLDIESATKEEVIGGIVAIYDENKQLESSQSTKDHGIISSDAIIEAKNNGDVIPDIIDIVSYDQNSQFSKKASETITEKLLTKLDDGVNNTILSSIENNNSNVEARFIEKSETELGNSIVSVSQGDQDNINQSSHNKIENTESVEDNLRGSTVSVSESTQQSQNVDKFEIERESEVSNPSTENNISNSVNNTLYRIIEGEPRSALTLIENSNHPISEFEEKTNAEPNSDIEGATKKEAIEGTVAIYDEIKQLENSQSSKDHGIISGDAIIETKNSGDVIPDIIDIVGYDQNSQFSKKVSETITEKLLTKLDDAVNNTILSSIENNNSNVEARFIEKSEAELGNSIVSISQGDQDSINQSSHIKIKNNELVEGNLRGSTVRVSENTQQSRNVDKFEIERESEVSNPSTENNISNSVNINLYRIIEGEPRSSLTLIENTSHPISEFEKKPKTAVDIGTVTGDSSSLKTESNDKIEKGNEGSDEIQNVTNSQLKSEPDTKLNENTVTVTVQSNLDTRSKIITKHSDIVNVNISNETNDAINTTPIVDIENLRNGLIDKEISRSTILAANQNSGIIGVLNEGRKSEISAYSELKKSSYSESQTYQSENIRDSFNEEPQRGAQENIVVISESYHSQPRNESKTKLETQVNSSDSEEKGSVIQSDYEIEGSNKDLNLSNQGDDRFNANLNDKVSSVVTTVEINKSDQTLSKSDAKLEGREEADTIIETEAEVSSQIKDKNNEFVREGVRTDLVSVTDSSQNSNTPKEFDTQLTSDINTDNVIKTTDKNQVDHNSQIISEFSVEEHNTVPISTAFETYHDDNNLKIVTPEGEERRSAVAAIKSSQSNQLTGGVETKFESGLNDSDLFIKKSDYDTNGVTGVEVGQSSQIVTISGNDKNEAINSKISETYHGNNNVNIETLEAKVRGGIKSVNEGSQSSQLIEDFKTKLESEVNPSNFVIVDTSESPRGLEAIEGKQNSLTIYSETNESDQNSNSFNAETFVEKIQGTDDIVIEGNQSDRIIGGFDTKLESGANDSNLTITTTPIEGSQNGQAIKDYETKLLSEKLNSVVSDAISEFNGQNLGLNESSSEVKAELKKQMENRSDIKDNLNNTVFIKVESTQTIKEFANNQQNSQVADTIIVNETNYDKVNSVQNREVNANLNIRDSNLISQTANEFISKLDNGANDGVVVIKENPTTQSVIEVDTIPLNGIETGVVITTEPTNSNQIKIESSGLTNGEDSNLSVIESDYSSQTLRGLNLEVENDVTKATINENHHTGGGIDGLFEGEVRGGIVTVSEDKKNSEPIKLTNTKLVSNGVDEDVISTVNNSFTKSEFSEHLELIRSSSAVQSDANVSDEDESYNKHDSAVNEDDITMSSSTSSAQASNEFGQEFEGKIDASLIIEPNTEHNINNVKGEYRENVNTAINNVISVLNDDSNSQTYDSSRIVNGSDELLEHLLGSIVADIEQSGESGVNIDNKSSSGFDFEIKNSTNSQIQNQFIENTQELTEDSFVTESELSSNEKYELNTKTNNELNNVLITLVDDNHASDITSNFNENDTGEELAEITPQIGIKNNNDIESGFKEQSEAEVSDNVVRLVKNNTSSVTVEGYDAKSDGIVDDAVVSLIINNDTPPSANQYNIKHEIKGSEEETTDFDHSSYDALTNSGQLASKFINLVKDDQSNQNDNEYILKLEVNGYPVDENDQSGFVRSKTENKESSNVVRSVLKANIDDQDESELSNLNSAIISVVQSDLNTPAANVIQHIQSTDGNTLNQNLDHNLIRNNNNKLVGIKLSESEAKVVSGYAEKLLREISNHGVENEKDLLNEPNNVFEARPEGFKVINIKTPIESGSSVNSEELANQEFAVTESDSVLSYVFDDKYPIDLEALKESSTSYFKASDADVFIVGANDKDNGANGARSSQNYYLERIGSNIHGGNNPFSSQLGDYGQTIYTSK